MSNELVIRNGLIVDGTGQEAVTADVAIKDGLIVEVGKVSGAGQREVDADGALVTPGFVDIHTHYDGQATWSNRMSPSSHHGVTSVVMGNCGVGFAPVRPTDYDLLIELMEGVEDIPGVALSEGLSWEWESFPDYLDYLSKRQFDMDIGAQLPHAALRVYVMGQRGADREPATERLPTRWFSTVGGARPRCDVSAACARTRCRVAASPRLRDARVDARDLGRARGTILAAMRADIDDAHRSRLAPRSRQHERRDAFWRNQPTKDTLARAGISALYFVAEVRLGGADIISYGGDDIVR